MLELDVTTRLGELQLAVSLRAGRDCLALAGPSGAGKTTLLRIVAGLLAPSRGRVRCGDEIWLDTERDIRVAAERRRCGFVFQDHALFPHLSALDNVAYGLHALPRARRRARAQEELERFGLGGRHAARPRELSGGERQRVALARALAPEPRALLLDEPLRALDARTHAHARAELSELLQAAPVPSLLVTHDFAEAALLAEEVAVIDGGRIVQRGTPAQLAEAPASAFVADFTGASVLTGVASTHGGGLTAVALDGGGELLSTDGAPPGPVAASVHPWDVTLEPAGAAAHTSSARNRVAATVASVTVLGNRARVGLRTPQPLAAELTGEGVRALGLTPGDRVVASFKATGTRLTRR